MRKLICLMASLVLQVGVASAQDTNDNAPNADAPNDNAPNDMERNNNAPTDNAPDDDQRNDDQRSYNERNNNDLRNRSDRNDNGRGHNGRRGGPWFADSGTLTISSDAAFTIQRQSTSGVPGGTTSIYLSPAADYFVVDNVSIGGFIGFNYVRAGDNDSMRFAIGPRAGYNFHLNEMWSVWPRAGVSLAVTNADNDPGPAAEATTFALNLFVPLMVHPVRHFFIGMGPFLDTDLSGDARTTVFGLKLTTGGWLDLGGGSQDDD